MRYLLDTNVYIVASRSVEARERFRVAFFPLLPATFLSAVVAYELAVNAEDRRTRDRLDEFVRPMERAGRIVTPGYEEWLEAARIVTRISERDPSWRTKLPALLNDVLIAVSARRIGAMVVTHNRDDFRLILRHKDFALRVLEPPGDPARL